MTWHQASSIKHQRSIKLIWSVVLLSITTQVFSFNLKDLLTHGHTIIQLGGYWSIQGKAQHINIDGLIGDDFTVTSGKDRSGLVGIGYLIDGQEKDLFKIAYGINAFYLAKTGVSGNVVQEGFFTNLFYGYHVTHYPVYAIVTSTIHKKLFKYALTIDLGIGPNFMHTSNLQEHSIDGGITIPDNAFSGHTTTAFSAMTGVGIKFNNFFGSAPLECGYKFFYLGQGSFTKKTNQLLNTLNTGSDYANAVMCSITV